jgi:hypothetical protein
MQISRVRLALICGQFYRRHHPLTKSLWKKRAKPERQKAQKAAMNLSQYDLSLAICRQLSPFAASSDAHSGSDEGNEAIFRQTSSLSTA